MPRMPTLTKGTRNFSISRGEESPFGDAYQAPARYTLDAAEVTASDRQASTGVLDRTTRKQILTLTTNLYD